MTASAPRPYDGPSAATAPHDRTIAVASAVLVLIGLPVAWLGGNTSTGDVIGMIVAIAVVLGLMAAGFLWLLPRERAASHRTARTALVLGVLAVITGLVFWTGIPLAIGATAVALALPLRSEGRAATALVLGAIGLIGSFVLLLVG
jgi:hypothetical protein